MRPDMTAVARALEPAGVLADAVQVGILELFNAAVRLDPVLHVVLIPPSLIAVEAEHTAPHLAERTHRHACGANRACAFRRIIAHEQRQLTRRAVRLNRHFIGQICRADAPVRQSRGMRVDRDQRRAVIAAERLAGDRIHAVLNAVLLGHLDGQLFRTVRFRRTELLGITACRNARVIQRKFPRCARNCRNRHQHTERRSGRQLQKLIHLFSSLI